MRFWIQLSIGCLLIICGAVLFLKFAPPDHNEPTHWKDAQIVFSQDHQWELVCDDTKMILAVIQPDDGGGMVLWGADRVAYGTYIDVESAQRAAERLKFKCR
jgi:hypothetical protein